MGDLEILPGLDDQYSDDGLVRADLPVRVIGRHSPVVGLWIKPNSEEAKPGAGRSPNDGGMFADAVAHSDSRPRFRP